MMEYELRRLASYVNWPGISKVSPLPLARSGFYYSGTDEEVECFSCMTRLNASDNLQYRHRELAPQCEHLKNNPSKNISMKILDSAAEDRSKITEDGVSRLGDTVTDDAGVVSEKTQLTNSYVTLSELYRHAFSRAAKKGVFQSEVNSEIDRSRPDTERLKREEERLLTFHDWPSGAHAQPIDLAREGLFYTGSGDRVQCAFCAGFIRNWEPTDVPSVEHKKHFPNCNFVRGLAVENVPTVREPATVNGSASSTNCEDDGESRRVATLRSPGAGSIRESYATSIREPREQLLQKAIVEPPKFPQYSDVAKRIGSFRMGKVSYGQTAECLADAGFFFKGPGDKVQCFQCGGNLRDWEPEDNPWEQHQRWYGNCAYVKSHIPVVRHIIPDPLPVIPAAIGSYRVEPREVKARMDTPMVRAILDMGYSRDLIKSAIETRLSTTGDDFPSAEGLLEALFQLEEAASQTVASQPGMASGTTANSVYNSSSTSASSSSRSSGYGTASSSSSSSSSSTYSGALHRPDCVSMPQDKSSSSSSSSASSVASSLSMVPKSSENQTATSATAAVMATILEVASDAQSKSKGKKKRNKKKKLTGASCAASAAGDGEQMVESLNGGAQNEADKLSMEGDVNLEDIPDEEAIKYLEENRQLREARTCKVCMDAEVNTVFLPCGHLVCCDRCAPQLRSCPICRTFIRGTVKTFLS